MNLFCFCFSYAISIPVVPGFEIACKYRYSRIAHRTSMRANYELLS